jgi:hypothetical protein
MYYIATIGYETETDRGTIKLTKEKVLIEAESAEEAIMLANIDAAEDTRTSEVHGVAKAPFAYIVTTDNKPEYYSKLKK